MNEEAAANAGQQANAERTTAEAIEQVRSGLGVSELLALVMTADPAGPEPAPADSGTAPVTGPDAPLLDLDLDGLADATAVAAGRYLPQGHLDADADFFDAGGSSVHAV